MAKLFEIEVSVDKILGNEIPIFKRLDTNDGVPALTKILGEYPVKSEGRIVKMQFAEEREFEEGQLLYIARMWQVVSEGCGARNTCTVKTGTNKEGVTNSYLFLLPNVKLNKGDVSRYQTAFNQTMGGGRANELKAKLSEAFGVELRSIILGTPRYEGASVAVRDMSALDPMLA